MTKRINALKIIESFVFALFECIAKGKFQGKWEKIVSVLFALPWPEASYSGRCAEGKSRTTKFCALIGIKYWPTRSCFFLTVLSHRPSAITSGSGTTWDHHKFLPSSFDCTLCDALAEADWTQQ
jgi:hypothetical protein